MAFERESFSVAKKSPLAKGDITVECNISAGFNVSKILSVSVEGNVQTVETLNGVVNYSGAIDTKVMRSEERRVGKECRL